MTDAYILERTLKLALENGFVYDGNCPQSVLQRWLREVHKLHIELKPVPNYDTRLNRDIYSWTIMVFTIKDKERVNVRGMLEVVGESYETSLEHGLDMALRYLNRLLKT